MTYEEAFEKFLPKAIAARAKHHVRSINLIGIGAKAEVEPLDLAVEQAFVWDLTPEGAYFWHTASAMYKDRLMLLCEN